MYICLSSNNNDSTDLNLQAEADPQYRSYSSSYSSYSSSSSASAAKAQVCAMLFILVVLDPVIVVFQAESDAQYNSYGRVESHVAIPVSLMLRILSSDETDDACRICWLQWRRRLLQWWTSNWLLSSTRLSRDPASPSACSRSRTSWRRELRPD